MSFFPQILTNLLFRLPMLLLWLVALILCLVRWKRHPKASLLGIVAFSILVLQALVNVGLDVWFFGVMGPPTSGMRVGKFYTLRSVLSTIVSAIGWGFLLVGFFVDRQPAQ
jgi:hypothetical protein